MASSVQIPSVGLNDGEQMPLVGLGVFVGTLNPQPEECASLINSFKHAIDMGYRHFDTADLYNTEEILGKALNAKIEDGTVKREDLFITTKLQNNNMRREQVIPALKASLKKLNLDYVDNFLIHWPVALTADSDWVKKIYKFDDDVSFVDTWKSMEECKKLGLARTIGVSNFNKRQLQMILDNCTIKPTNNQNEVHVFFQNKKLMEFCKKNDILTVCYSPLARPGSKAGSGVDIAGNTVLAGLAKKYNKSNQQIALKFLVQQGMPVIPKSSNPKRQFDNINLFDFEISEEDMKVIEGLDQNHRMNGLEDLLGGGKEFPFREEY